MDRKHLPAIENAYLVIENNIIVDYGTMEEWGALPTEGSGNH